MYQRPSSSEVCTNPMLPSLIIYSIKSYGAWDARAGTRECRNSKEHFASQWLDPSVLLAEITLRQTEALVT